MVDRVVGSRQVHEDSTGDQEPLRSKDRGLFSYNIDRCPRNVLVGKKPATS